MNELVEWDRKFISDYPSDFLPAGSVEVSQSSEDGSFTVKGFYYPFSGELHIQEVVQN